MVAMMATSSAMMAQNGITEIPDPEGVELMGTTLSPNGKFFGGVGYGVNEAWIYDMESKKFGLVFNEFLPVVDCLFHIGIINLSFDSYVFYWDIAKLPWKS